MKTTRLILAALLLTLPLLCWAQKNILDKYGDMKDVSSVYISKVMIENNSNLFTKDIYIGKITGQLNSVQILSTMNDRIKAQMKKDIRALVHSSKYELLMKQKGGVTSSEFYVNRKDDKVKELIMVMDGAATLKFVYLEGNMIMKDIQRIMMYQNTSWTGGDISIDRWTFDVSQWEGLEKLKALEQLSSLEKLDGLKKYMDIDSWKKLQDSMEVMGVELQRNQDKE